MAANATSYDAATGGGATDCVVRADPWVHQLAGAQRGALNGSHDAIGSKVFAQAWGLDATGNWSTFDEDPDGDGDWDLQQTRTANAVNELSAIGATEGTNWADPVYDRAGNMTSIPKPSLPTVLLSAIYDAWNRLVQVADGEVVIARFRYDGDSRRILKGFDTQAPSNPDGLDLYEHVYLSDQQVIETRQTASSAAEPESLQPKYQHVWSPRYIDALILRDENTDADSLCDDTRLYYLGDANYNVTALVNATGTVVERYLYAPYGDVTVLDPTFSADADGLSDVSNVTLYTGRELDVATGLYYYRARYYDSALGVFVGRDPIGYRADMQDLYRYVRSNALVRTDPSGQVPAAVIVGAIEGGCCAGCAVWLGATIQACWAGPCQNARNLVACIGVCVQNCHGQLGFWNKVAVDTECAVCGVATLRLALRGVLAASKWCVTHPALCQEIIDFITWGALHW